MGRNRIVPGKQTIPFSTGDQHSPAANTAAVVTYAAGPANVAHAISGLVATVACDAPLTAAPTVKIEDGSGNVVFEQALQAYITGATQAIIYGLTLEFPQPKRGTQGRAMIITIPAAGANKVGKLSILGHWTELA